MTKINVHQAKTSLSRLLSRAESGEEIVIARDGAPSVRLVPVGTHRKGRVKFGSLKGKIWYSDDLHLPMPESEVAEMLNDPLLAPPSPRRRTGKK